MVRTHTYKFKQKTNVLKHFIYVLILTWKPTRTRSKNNNNSRIILGILQKLEGKSLCGKNSFICTFTAHEGCESHYICVILMWGLTWMGMQPQLPHYCVCPKGERQKSGKLQKLGLGLQEQRQHGNGLNKCTSTVFEVLKLKLLLCVWYWCRTLLELVSSLNYWSMMWVAPREVIRILGNLKKLNGHENQQQGKDSYNAHPQHMTVVNLLLFVWSWCGSLLEWVYSLNYQTMMWVAPRKGTRILGNLQMLGLHKQQ
jgi:hypothetical protein